MKNKNLLFFILRLFATFIFLIFIGNSDSFATFLIYLCILLVIWIVPIRTTIRNLKEEKLPVYSTEYLNELREKTEKAEKQYVVSRQLFDESSKERIELQARLRKNAIDDVLTNSTAEIKQLQNEISNYDKKKLELEASVSSYIQKQDALTVSIENSKRKLESLKYSYKAVMSAIENFRTTGSPIDLSSDENFDIFAPVVDIPLHSYDVKTLKKQSTQVKKDIKSLVDTYSARYTTKQNATFYSLMVLSLNAEVENILLSLKFTNKDNCDLALKELIAKYMSIAEDGNKQIFPTILNFLNEANSLYSSLIDIEYQYYVKREAEKEEQRQIREQMSQEREELKRLQAEQKKIEAEEQKYQNEIELVTKKLEESLDTEKEIYLQRIRELESMLTDVANKKDEILNLQNGKAGNVYIISNLGSFGENVFKIGMTRRLDPMDRVRELGDASVPFSFDVHSMIFSNDAPSLEKALHTKFFEKRINKINSRKEFFRVTLDELEITVNELDASAEFKRTMLATEYHSTLDLEKEQTSA